VTGRHRLPRSDAADVAQTVWLRLVQNLGNLREPEALPGWISTTARNECLGVLNSRKRFPTYDPLDDPPEAGVDLRATPDDVAAGLLEAERHEALLAAFAGLSDRHRELLMLLVADPPVTYAEISERLGMPIGAIGPTRARAVERLRRSPALAALQDADQQASVIIDDAVVDRRS
jgi:RNA polymerase sigma factor (sigma-70 family)